MHHAFLHTYGSDTPSPMEAFAARSLFLLKAIDSTIDYLASNVAIVRQAALDTQATLEDLKTAQPSGPINASGQATSKLDQCLDMLHNIFNREKACHLAACNDSRLKPEDGVKDAYEEYLAVMTELHDAIFELKDWIETHDALLEPSTSGAFTTADDLFKSLMS